MLDVLLILTAAAGAPDPYPELPPLAVARALPSAASARAHVALGEKFLEGYTGGPVVSVVEWNLWYWRQVVMIHDVTRQDLERRRLLGELIDWLGWEAVLRGQLPPPVPLELIPVAP